MRDEVLVLGAIGLVASGSLAVLGGLGAFVLFNASGQYAVDGAWLMGFLYAPAAALIGVLASRQKGSKQFQKASERSSDDTDNIKSNQK